MNMGKRLFIYLNVVTTICLYALLLMAQSSSITTKDQKAKESVDTALKALGGADKIGDIKSLILKGTGTNGLFYGGVNAISGNAMTQINWTRAGSEKYDFELRILLPDSFIQIDRFTDRTTHSGVSRGAPLSSSSNANIISGDFNIRIDDWLCFLIGTFMKADYMPLALSSGKGSGRFTITNEGKNIGEVEFDSKTGYPSSIRYAMIVPQVGEMGGRIVTSPPQVFNLERRFRDRFSVGGIMFPRVITASADRIDRELLIEEVLINPELSLKEFEDFIHSK